MARERVTIECMECGHKFKRSVSRSTFEIKCPKCGGYDTDIETPIIPLVLTRKEVS
jgi:Zn finger protein HypA/HybF involved in hydrogenase expression